MPRSAPPTHRLALRRSASGVWTTHGPRAWRNRYYLFDVEVFVPETGRVEHNLVTDPYSVGLSRNSDRSLFVDLDARRLKPRGWNRLTKPQLAKPVDQAITELHVRDFSVSDPTRSGRPPRRLRRIRRRVEHLGRLPEEAGPGRHDDRAPAARQRHRDHRREQVHLAAAGLRPACVPAGQRGAAGVRQGDHRQGRLQLGLRPAALHDAGGLVLDETERAAADQGVPGHGRRAEPQRAAGGDGRGLQPHQRLRPDRP